MKPSSKVGKKGVVNFIPPLLSTDIHARHTEMAPPMEFWDEQFMMGQIHDALLLFQAPTLPLGNYGATTPRSQFSLDVAANTEVVSTGNQDTTDRKQVGTVRIGSGGTRVPKVEARLKLFQGWMRILDTSRFLMAANEIDDVVRIKNSIASASATQFPVQLAVLFAQYVVLQLDDLRAALVIMDNQAEPEKNMQERVRVVENRINRAKAVLNTVSQNEKYAATSSSRVVTITCASNYAAQLFGATYDPPSGDSRIRMYSVLQPLVPTSSIIDDVYAAIRDRGVTVRMWDRNSGARLVSESDSNVVYVIGGDLIAAAADNKIQSVTEEDAVVLSAFSVTTGLTIIGTVWQEGDAAGKGWKFTAGYCSPPPPKVGEQPTVVHIAIATAPFPTLADAISSIMTDKVGKTLGKPDEGYHRSMPTTYVFSKHETKFDRQSRPITDLYNTLLLHLTNTDANAIDEEGTSTVISLGKIHPGWIEMFTGYLAVRILYCSDGVANDDVPVPNTRTEDEQKADSEKRANNRKSPEAVLSEAAFTYCFKDGQTPLDRVRAAYQAVQVPGTIVE